MDIFVLIIVLLSALTHATWNIFIKIGQDRLSATALMFLLTAVLSTVFLLLKPMPLPSGMTWVYLCISSVIHVIYIYLLSQAYEIGDFTQIYPIARGGAPFVSGVCAFLFIGEVMDWQQVGALVLIVGGVLSLSYSPKMKGRFHFDKAFGLAVVIACLIGVYTLIDGVGARHHGDAVSFIAWLFILTGYPFAIGVYMIRRHAFIEVACLHWKKALIASGASGVAYVAATWAMTQAPIGLVAALRETSVLFGLVLAHFILREQFGMQRILSTLIIFAGVLLLKV